jgi:hypothetical protein
MTNEQADLINDLRDRLARQHAYYRALDLDADPEDYRDILAAIKHTESELAEAERRSRT